MADIMHQALINAPSKQIYPLIATKDGLQQWLRSEEGWKIQGDQSLGGKLTFYYGDGHHAIRYPGTDIWASNPDHIKMYGNKNNPVIPKTSSPEKTIIPPQQQ